MPSQVGLLLSFSSPPNTYTLVSIVLVELFHNRGTYNHSMTFTFVCTNIASMVLHGVKFTYVTLLSILFLFFQMSDSPFVDAIVLYRRDDRIDRPVHSPGVVLDTVPRIIRDARLSLPNRPAHASARSR